jgi:hypothetical protein
MKSKNLRRRIEELEEKMGLDQFTGEARKRYEKLIEERFALWRSHKIDDGTLKLWEALWELEKKFAEKEERKMNFGLNVVFVDKADAPNFKKLRDYVGLPPLSSEHKKAIEEVKSELEQSHEKGNQR